LNFALIAFILERGDVLLNLQRKAIFDLIRENPNIHYRKIMRKLSLKPGTLSYHLDVLEKNGLLKTVQRGEYCCYYPDDSDDKNQIILSTIQQSIMEKITKHPGITISQLSFVMEKNKMVLNYHLGILIDLDLIRQEKKGRTPKFFIKSKINY
jgi:predicted transcriptional regulator